MIKLTFFFAAIVIGLPYFINEVDAIKGQNFDDIVQPFNSTQIAHPDGKIYYQFTTHPERVYDGDSWVDYLLTQDANTIRVETGQGSFEIDKNTCNFSFYNAGLINGNPTIPSDTYLARQSADGIIFNDVNQINNAVCQTVIIESGNEEDGFTVEVQTIRNHAMGEMKIRYIKDEGQQLKSQMEVINTSGLNDRFFAFTQIMQVPQVINFGSNQIDLATKNGTTYDRDFIKANKDKLVRLSDKVGYDFDKGFFNLKDITVVWDGTNAFLHFDYSHNALILPDGNTFIIDPFFTTGNVTTDEWFIDSDNNGLCDFYSSTGLTTSRLIIGVNNSASTDDCMRADMQFNITGIGSEAGPLGITIVDEDGELVTNFFAWELLQTDFPDNERLRIWSIENEPTTRTHAQRFADAHDGNIYLYNSTSPDVIDFLEIDSLNQNFTDDMQAAVDANQVWFGIGLTAENETQTAVRQHFEMGSSTHAAPVFNPILSITYYLTGTPNGINDLVISNVLGVTLDLDWTEPLLFGGTLDGYQINFTSPNGDPLVVITNNTGTSDTSFEVSGLTQLTQYSFRVQAWTEVAGNVTGLIANTTTIALGNFTVGFFDLNATAADARDFKYTRIDLNTTSTNLEVVYPLAFNTSCTFSYKFAQTNDTYSNLATVPVGATELKATFQFHNIQNEVIGVRCVDETTGVNAPYLLTITAFPLLQQFINFSDGTYGTQGQFGAIDLITLGVIIVMMVGFNRVNESVGAIFAVIILGFFAFFDIVEWFSFMFGTFAVVIMLTIASTRKM